RCSGRAGAAPACGGSDQDSRKCQETTPPHAPNVHACAGRDNHPFGWGDDGWYRDGKHGYSCGMAVLLKKKLHASAEAVPDVRRAVPQALTDAGLVDAELQEAVALTVTEAASNVVRHAYPQNRSGDLQITVTTSKLWLEIDVDDE